MRKHIERTAIALLMAVLAFPAAAKAEEKDHDRERAERLQRLVELRERRELEQQLRDARRAFEAAARQVEQIQSKLVEEKIAQPNDIHQRFRMNFSFGNRARIGVVVDTAAASSQKGSGAEIIAITPGSSAEEAGLRPGDVVISMNGSELAPPGATGVGRSSAAAELVSRAGSLEPGDKVTLRYRRGSETREATLEARGTAGPAVWVTPGSGSFAVGSQFWPYALLEPDEPDEESLRKWLDFELVALNPDLGKYFGSASGVLVVKTPENPPLEVRAGDVIIRIGDIELATPLEAVRSLRSLEPGQQIDVSVLRDRKVVTVKAVVPQVRRVLLPRVKVKED